MTSIFNPSKSVHYNVICVRQLTFIGIIQFCFQIYSSETKCWCNLIIFLPHQRILNSLELCIGMVLFSGLIYLELLLVCILTLMKTWLIKCHCLQILVWWGRKNGDERKWGYFGESGDHLHLIGSSDCPSIELNVYEIERNYSIWFIKFYINLNPLVTQFPEMVSDSHNASLPMDLFYMRFSILCVVRSEVEEESFIDLQIPRKILGYNFNTSSFNRIWDSDGTLSYGLWMNKRCYTVFEFIERFCFCLMLFWSTMCLKNENLGLYGFLVLGFKDFLK